MIPFGLQLHPQFTTWDEVRDAALLAEQAGWDALMTWDHFVPLSGDVTGPNFEGWQLLPALAAITTKPLIGMLVTGNTYRHPAVLANMVATLDHISHGRAVLGIGAAWKEHEHRMYGIPFDTPGVRLAKLREATKVIRALLDDGTVTHHGKHYELTDATLGTRPIQKRLPILVGGGGERGQILVRDDLNAVDQRMREVARRSRAEGGQRAATAGKPEDIVKRLLDLHRSGIRGFLFGMSPPYARETIERVMTEVKPRFLELAG